MNRKERFDSMSVLYARAWENFNERRKYEINFSISIYTIFAISIGGILVNHKIISQINKCLILIGIIVLGVSLVSFHAYWLFKADRKNNDDRLRAIRWEKKMEKLIGNIDKKEKWFKDKRFKDNWSHMVQISVSICLLLALIFSAVIIYLSNPSAQL